MKAMTSRGRLIVLSGPSGTGKGTIAGELIRLEPAITYSISCTTRPPRPGDVEGKTYYFVDRGTFEQMIQENAFLEHAFFYDTYYGTPKSFVYNVLDSGRDCLVEIDPKGAYQIFQKEPDAFGIYVLPPSMRTLRDRLVARATESPERIKTRFAAALAEMSNLDMYRYALINGELDKAVAQLRSIVLAERNGEVAHESLSNKLHAHLDRLKEEEI